MGTTSLLPFSAWSRRSVTSSSRLGVGCSLHPWHTEQVLTLISEGHYSPLHAMRGPCCPWPGRPRPVSISLGNGWHHSLPRPEVGNAVLGIGTLTCEMAQELRQWPPRRAW